jgi:poly(3-hydroxybutyrate) depolymerase
MKALLITMGLFLVSCGGSGSLSDKKQIQQNDDSGSDAGYCQQGGWGSGTTSMTFNGVERQFRIYLPANYSSANPSSLLLGFHGWGGDENEFLSSQIVRDQLDQHNYVMLAPLGLGAEEPGSSPSSWSFSGSISGLDGDGVNSEVANDSDKICDINTTPDYTYPSCKSAASNSCSWTQCLDDDIGFVANLVAQAEQNLCIDSGRIFAVGGSNGGMFIWDLGRDERTADTFHAIATIIGLPHRGYLAGPIKANGLPVISITGMKDNTVPPGNWSNKSFTTTANGETFFYTGATAIAESWGNALGCDISSPSERVKQDIASNLECRSWNYCEGGNRFPGILDCRGADMGHVYNLDQSWPLIMAFFNDQ